MYIYNIYRYYFITLLYIDVWAYIKVCRELVR